MGEDQKTLVEQPSSGDNVDAVVATATNATNADENKPAEVTRSEQILRAKELYSNGSRNFLVKSYAEAAEDLSEVCKIYDDLYGNLSDELGMPYLLYAKSLIALALDENKVIDVPDEEDDDEDDEEEDDGEEAAEGETNGEAATSSSSAKTNGSAAPPLDTIKEKSDEKTDEADSTEDTAAVATASDEKAKDSEEKMEVENGSEEATVTSTADGEIEKKPEQNGKQVSVVDDDEKPSTSKGQQSENGEAVDDADEEDAASTLQLAWEVLELADKIFTRQGSNGLPNLAEVKTELANISFENNALDTARSDYEQALKIYGELPNNYRRAEAEIHYKIGLTYLMQQSNKEGADSLKKACHLIEKEIEEIKAKEEQTEKEKNTVQDLEETKQEIWVKIAEIEETEAQTMAEVRAALDSYIKPFGDSAKASETGSSSSSSAVTSSSSTAAKPTDISHLIKRKKIEDPQDEAEEAVASPAKRAAVAEN